MNEMRESIANKVTHHLTKIMLIVNLVVIIIVCTYASYQMKSIQEDYIVEVVHNISSTVETSMEIYFYASKVAAVDQSIQELLMASSKTNPMGEYKEIDSILTELTAVKDSYDNSIANISIVSVAQDSYIMSDGTVSVRDTIADRPYYRAITEQETIVTDPYIHSISNVTGYLFLHQYLHQMDL